MTAEESLMLAKKYIDEHDGGGGTVSQKVIFDGAGSSLNTIYNLTGNITDYDFICIDLKDATDGHKQSMFVNSDFILQSGCFLCSIKHGTSYSDIGIHFINSSTFRLTGRNDHYYSLYVKRIIGIKGVVEL